MVHLENLERLKAIYMEPTTDTVEKQPLHHQGEIFNTVFFRVFLLMIRTESQSNISYITF